MEAVCFGTRAAIDALIKAGIVGSPNGTGTCSDSDYSGVEMAVAGGATRSPLFLQMHADVTGVPVVVGEFDNAPLLGSAILAAVGAGYFTDDRGGVGAGAGARGLVGEAGKDGKYDGMAIRNSVTRAVAAMVRPARRLEPDTRAKAAYDKVFSVYERAAEAVRHISHSLVDLSHDEDLRWQPESQSSNPPRQSQSTPTSRLTPTPTPCPSSGPTAAPTTAAPAEGSHSGAPLPLLLRSGREGVIMPSILSADFGYLADEADTCVRAGAKWMHVDVCDGSPTCGGALTL
jgi:FGGY family of carbohydrate kinases, C-terminal domain/Ribulose-phosphate 3 epimerase family